MAKTPVRSRWDRLSARMLKLTKTLKLCVPYKRGTDDVTSVGGETWNQVDKHTEDRWKRVFKFCVKHHSTSKTVSTPKCESKFWPVGRECVENYSPRLLTIQISEYRHCLYRFLQMYFVSVKVVGGSESALLKLRSIVVVGQKDS